VFLSFPLRRFQPADELGPSTITFLLPILRQRAGITSVLVLMVVVSLMAWFVTVLFSRHLPRGTGTVAATLSHS
jgi:multisubunit Na+/H+ antiporter MnhF subunit